MKISKHQHRFLLGAGLITVYTLVAGFITMSSERFSFLTFPLAPGVVAPFLVAEGLSIDVSWESGVVPFLITMFLIDAIFYGLVGVLVGWLVDKYRSMKQPC
ncbi:MAG: hypothetical protein WAZ14_01550 [Patescibacteria group bacterium]